MKMRALTLGLLIFGTAAPAFAQNTLETSQEEYNADGAAMGAQDESSAEAPPPPTAAPTGAPPPPTNVPPPPNSDGQQPEQQQQQQMPQGSSPQGQYVYTQQYGWVYAPYDQSYTYVDPNASAAQMYIYRPSIGWGWYISPWVLGVGARPYWGAWGPNRYSWYSHPWFHTRIYGGGPRYYGGGWGGAHYNTYAPRRSWSPGPAHAYSHGAWGGGGGRGGGGHRR